MSRQDKNAHATCVALNIAGLAIAFGGCAWADTQTDVSWIGGGLCVAGGAAFVLIIRTPWNLLSGIFIAAGLGALAGGLASAPVVTGICAGVALLVALVAAVKVTHDE